MTTNEWTEFVLKMSSRIADEDFQRVAWFGQGPLVSSPLEDFLGVFDDALLSDFLSAPEVSLSEDQRAAAVTFAEMLERYFEGLPDNPDPAQVFGDSKWDRVRAAAREFVSLMKA